MSYGARGATSSEPKRKDDKRNNVLDNIASIQVPHAWFIHFYILSLVLLCFWLHQILFSGPAFRFIASFADQDFTRSMTPQQVALTWLFMTEQSLRRLYECAAFSSNSTSKMWIGHWAMGLGFYAAMSVTVWVEGIRKR